MNVQELQDSANEVAIARLELESLEQQREAFIQASPQLVELNLKIEEAVIRKRQVSDKMLEMMRTAQLKSWKNEKANFARAVRRTAEFDPIIRKQIEDRLKKGESVENWTLREQEYISIKIIKN